MSSPIAIFQLAQTETGRVVELTEQQRQASADALILLLVGVGLVGIVLLAMVLVIGNRTRRVVRDDPTRPGTNLEYPAHETAEELAAASGETIEPPPSATASAPDSKTGEPRDDPSVS